jgi:ribA/ribD-fused uncharacterized protein
MDYYTQFVFFCHAGSPFSNWYASAFQGPGVDGNLVTFETNEHYVMYQKAVLFKDYITANAVLGNASPGAAKALGREVRNFKIDVWQNNCMRIVTDGLVLKFSQNDELRKLFIATGDRIFVETSPGNNIWGIGLDESTARKRNPDQWPGKNQLGRCLVDARARVKQVGFGDVWQASPLAGRPSAEDRFGGPQPDRVSLFGSVGQKLDELDLNRQREEARVIERAFFESEREAWAVERATLLAQTRFAIV